MTNNIKKAVIFILVSVLVVTAGLLGQIELVKHIIFPLFIIIWGYMLVKAMQTGDVPQPLQPIAKIRSRTDAFVWGWVFFVIVTISYALFIFQWVNDAAKLI